MNHPYVSLWSAHLWKNLVSAEENMTNPLDSGGPDPWRKTFTEKLITIVKLNYQDIGQSMEMERELVLRED